MARSLLPSTWRKGSREAKAKVNRGTRHAVRVRMAHLERDSEAAHDCPDLDADSTRKMRQVVRDRRSGDKVNPFLRWARSVTEDLPRDERLKHVRGLMPRGLIGDHALSHLSWDEHFETAAEQMVREARRRRWSRPPQGFHFDCGLLAELLRELLQVPGGQRAFNDYLKHACATGWSDQRGHDGRRHRVWYGKGPTRLLLGTHDVLAFVAVLTHHRDWKAPPLEGTPSLPEATQAAYAFLQAFREHRGDLAATLAALPRRKLPKTAPY